MPPDPTLHNREPAPDHDGQGAGSVVVGADPAGPCGVVVLHVTARRTDEYTDRMTAVTEGFQRMRDSLVAAAPGVRRSLADTAAAFQVWSSVSGPGQGSAVMSDDAMDWSPPADGEETPRCPA